MTDIISQLLTGVQTLGCRNLKIALHCIEVEFNSWLLISKYEKCKLSHLTIGKLPHPHNREMPQHTQQLYNMISADKHENNNYACYTDKKITCYI